MEEYKLFGKGRLGRQGEGEVILYAEQQLGRRELCCGDWGAESQLRACRLGLVGKPTWEML